MSGHASTLSDAQAEKLGDACMSGDNRAIDIFVAITNSNSYVEQVAAERVSMETYTSRDAESNSGYAAASNIIHNSDQYHGVPSTWSKK